MKYILKRKWHESQVEEVGHVYKGNENFDSKGALIALLVDAGYLEKVELCECGGKNGKDCPYAGTFFKEGVGRCITCSKFKDKPTPTLDLWTTEPPVETVYEYITSFGNIDWCVWKGNEWDNFRLKTGNCHKTSESAEEALKRLLEK